MDNVDLFIQGCALIVYCGGRVSYVNEEELQRLATGPDSFAARVAKAVLQVEKDLKAAP